MNTGATNTKHKPTSQFGIKTRSHIFMGKRVYQYHISVYANLALSLECVNNSDSTEGDHGNRNDEAEDYGPNLRYLDIGLVK